MSIFEMLLSQVQPSQLEQIGRQVGVDQDQVASVLEGALPGMLAGLSKNASSSEGAEALWGALERDHSGGVLDDVSGFLGNSGGMADGAKILGHIFGGKQGGVERSVSQASGVDASSVAQIMAMVAPLIMGALGKAKNQMNLDPSALSQMLGQERQAAQQSAPDVMDFFGKMLDSDGDGSSMDEIAKIGSSLLGGLFKGR
jgi:hypothetical protein